jgi:uroporphyrinogen decarboxylase
MNAKENALRIIRFDHPERVAQSPPTYTLLYQGCNHEAYDGELGDDHPVGSRWTDIWGIGWHKIQEGVMGLPKANPLAKVEALRRYHWPNPDDERICARIYRMAGTDLGNGTGTGHASWTGNDRFLAGSHRDTLWEKAYMLVGMETLMMYFLTEPEFVREVLHHIMDFQLGIAQHYARLGVEFVAMGDDLGTQLGPLLGPRIVEHFLVPEYERLFSFYRTRHTLIGFHSCGNVDSMLDAWMRLGVDVLNPIQATANDLDRVRARTQGRMALQGGVSSAVVMEGPPERIAAEVRQRIAQLGQGGGYFCSPDQGMPYPTAHIEAFVRAVEEYGRYEYGAP